MPARLFLGAAALLALAAAGCRSPRTGGDDREARVGGNVIKVEDTANYRVHPGLEIAAGNFWQEEYVDAKNQKQKGLTAALWILSPKTAPNRDHVRVHEGQELTAGDQKVRVLEIRKLPLERAYVKLELTPQ
jgi:hypothetical protein